MAELKRVVSAEEEKALIESLEITEMEKPVDVSEIKTQIQSKKEAFKEKFGE